VHRAGACENLPVAAFEYLKYALLQRRVIVVRVFRQGQVVCDKGGGIEKVGGGWEKEDQVEGLLVRAGYWISEELSPCAAFGYLKYASPRRRVIVVRVFRTAGVSDRAPRALAGVFRRGPSPIERE
jgi:hypothetical protein